MSRLIIVLDSCRHDTFVKAYPKEMEEVLGPVQKVQTWSNLTLSVFAYYYCTGALPGIKGKEIAFHNYLSQNGLEWHLWTDNQHLSPVISLINKVKGDFTSYNCNIQKPYNMLPWICNNFKLLNKTIPFEAVLWTSNTHQPYNFQQDTNKDWVTDGPDFAKFNDTDLLLHPDIFEQYKDRQVVICTKVLEYLWENLLQNYLDCEIIITADHGESFGENGKFGHGNDNHDVQFEVPLVHYKPGGV